MRTADTPLEDIPPGDGGVDGQFIVQDNGSLVWADGPVDSTLRISPETYVGDDDYIVPEGEGHVILDAIHVDGAGKLEVNGADNGIKVL
ncbi:hypothetical protein [Halanaeroarchaeum sp. HSR-CO]|uniref:hypothetical protein n=1 Tax=Halanaeroarchaeum sp. HSR-CO TaxID=2866382 RepID=UPI00217E5BA3|nr:hypothetical protein [Halanaeroarchaeum sp. HSR-CO]